MKKSSSFNARSNYQVKSKKQYIDLLKHICRVLGEELTHYKKYGRKYSQNVDLERLHLNDFVILGEDGNYIDLKKLHPQEIYEKLMKHLNDMKEEYKTINHNSKEEQSKIRQLKDQKRNTINRLKSKDLSLEEFEELEITPKDYIDFYWSKEYKSKRMTERMKKRTLESLENYLKIKDNYNKKDKSLQLTSHHTFFQELLITIPKNNGINFTNKEIKKVIEKHIHKERERGNNVSFFTIHRDETQVHRHIIITSKDFKIIENQQKDILKKFNLDYDLKNLTEEQLIKIGELEQQLDRQILNDSMERDIHFDLIHNINDKITDEERKNRNRRINRKNKRTNIDNRDFNQINLKREEQFKKELRLHIQELEIFKEEQNLLFAQQRLNFQRNMKPLNLKNKKKKVLNSTFKRDNQQKEFNQEIDNIIKELKEEKYIVSDKNIELLQEIKKQINEDSTIKNINIYRNLKKQLEPREVEIQKPAKRKSVIEIIQNNPSVIKRKEEEQKKQQEQEKQRQIEIESELSTDDRNLK